MLERILRVRELILIGGYDLREALSNACVSSEVYHLIYPSLKQGLKIGGVIINPPDNTDLDTLNLSAANWRLLQTESYEAMRVAKLASKEGNEECSILWRARARALNETSLKALNLQNRNKVLENRLLEIREDSSA